MVGQESRIEWMTVPQLTDREYSDLVERWNRRRRGPEGMPLEPCMDHDWVRVPYDTEADMIGICRKCMRTYRPSEHGVVPRHVGPARNRRVRPI